MKEVTVDRLQHRYNMQHSCFISQRAISCQLIFLAQTAYLYVSGEHVCQPVRAAICHMSRKLLAEIGRLNELASFIQNSS